MPATRSTIEPRATMPTVSRRSSSSPRSTRSWSRCRYLTAISILVASAADLSIDVVETVEQGGLPLCEGALFDLFALDLLVQRAQLVHQLSLFGFERIFDRIGNLAADEGQAAQRRKQD